MSKKSNIYFLVIVIILFFLSCKNGNTTLESPVKNTTIDSIEKLLHSDSFYKSKPTYIATFNQQYSNAINIKDYETAKKYLAAYGCVINDLGISDSNFTTIASSFLLKKHPVVIDSSYAMIAHFISWDYYLQANFDSLQYWAKKSLEFCTFKNADQTKGYGYTDLASYYINTNKIDSAIIFDIAVAKLYEAANNDQGLWASYFNIGSCYFVITAYKQSEDYMNKAAALSLRSKDTSNYLKTLAFMPIYDHAFKTDSLSQIKRIDNLTNIYSKLSSLSYSDSFFYHILLAKKNIKIKDYDAAKKNLRVCEKIVDQNINSSVETFYFDIDWEWSFATKNPLKNNTEILTIAKDLEKRKDYMSASTLYRMLSENAYLLGDAEKQYQYKIKEEQFLEIVTQAKYNLIAFEADKKFETEKKENQILLQQKNLASNQRSIIALIASLIVLSLGIVLFYFYQKQKQLKLQKAEAQKFTQQLFEKTEEERKRIATDLHDGISHDLISLKTLDKNDLGLLNSKIDIIINDIRIISRNLHPVLFEKVGLQNSIEQIVERVQQQNNFMLTSEINYRNGLAKSAEMQVYRIIQEAVTNMLKYANAVAGKINITESNNNVVVEIKDNGKGFNVNTILNSSNSFGLHNILERSRSIGGTANIISEANGTIIKIIIPKQKL
jgi:two-component system, NarL family, sensor kinase